jgi:ankyrin repeat protein
MNQLLDFVRLPSSHYECKYGLEVEDVDVHLKGRFDWTILHYACKYRPELVTLLLEQGADVNAQAEWNETPLHLACSFQPSVVLTLLKKGANPNVEDIHGNIPLVIALDHHPELVPDLLQFGADPTLKQEEVLHVICEKQPSLFPFIIDAVDVNVRNSRGTTALHFAAAHHPELVPLLLERGANPNLKDIRGRIPLHYACVHQASAVEPLLKYYIETKDVEGNTPLRFAVDHQPSVVRSLLEHGADVWAQNDAGIRPLDLIADTPLLLASLLPSQKE